MLKTSLQKKHFLKEWENMVSHLKAFYDSGNQEDLHRFRVQYKKINALQTFLKSNLKRKKYLKDLKNIFKHAGIIRAAYINLQLIDLYKLESDEFKTEQTKTLLKKTNEFFLHRELYFATLHRAGKKLLESFKDEKNKVITEEYSKKLKQLDEFFSDTELKTGELHNVRKEIKLLLYYHNMLHKPLIDKIRLNTSYLNRLQDAIGKWNDFTSVIGLLESGEYKSKDVISKLKTQSYEALNSVKFLSENFSCKAVVGSTEFLTK